MIVGRKIERIKLRELLEKEESQFCVLYGRRRVGKTFLIRETFDYKFAFQHAGVANGTLYEQLDQFRSALKDSGYRDCPPLKSWFEAFDALKVVIQQSAEEKKIVFIGQHLDKKEIKALLDFCSMT